MFSYIRTPRRSDFFTEHLSKTTTTRLLEVRFLPFFVLFQASQIANDLIGMVLQVGLARTRITIPTSQDNTYYYIQRKDGINGGFLTLYTKTDVAWGHKRLKIEYIVGKTNQTKLVPTFNIFDRPLACLTTVRVVVVVVLTIVGRYSLFLTRPRYRVNTNTIV